MALDSPGPAARQPVHVMAALEHLHGLWRVLEYEVDEPLQIGKVPAAPLGLFLEIAREGRRELRSQPGRQAIAAAMRSALLAKRPSLPARFDMSSQLKRRISRPQCGLLSRFCR